jgi:hypothetical protein
MCKWLFEGGFQQIAEGLVCSVTNAQGIFEITLLVWQILELLPECSSFLDRKAARTLKVRMRKMPPTGTKRRSRK